VALSLQTRGNHYQQHSDAKAEMTPTQGKEGHTPSVTSPEVCLQYVINAPYLFKHNKGVSN